MSRLVLASASPGRLKVLRQAGIEPLVVVSGVDEDAVAAALGPDAWPGDVVCALARAKAEQVAGELDGGVAADCVVLGCDSMLSIDGRLCGKPGSADAAASQWRLMGGRSGELHTGQMVVNASVADQVVEVFRRLFAARVPIEQMRVVTQADLDAPPTGDGNNTAAYACRPTRGSTSWSAHAYGLAVDVNPFMNPYTRDSSDLVLPELASAYLDRSWRRPGMVLPGGVVTRAFAAAGWTWGGTFSTVHDPMHFSANGR